MSMPARSKSWSLRGRRRDHVGQRRVQLRHAGVDQHARIGMVDDVHVDRHTLTLDVQVANEDRRDGDRGEGVHRVRARGLSLRVLIEFPPSSAARPHAATRRGTRASRPRTHRSAGSRTRLGQSGASSRRAPRTSFLDEVDGPSPGGQVHRGVVRQPPRSVDRSEHVRDDVDPAVRVSRAELGPPRAPDAEVDLEPLRAPAVDQSV